MDKDLGDASDDAAVDQRLPKRQRVRHRDGWTGEIIGPADAPGREWQELYRVRDDAGRERITAREFLTRQEAAEFLRVSTRTLDRLFGLPRSYVGVKPLFALRDLTDYVAQSRITPATKATPARAPPRLRKAADALRRDKEKVHSDWLGRMKAVFK